MGNVVDADTGVPIAEVIVTAIPKAPAHDIPTSSSSNAGGFFEISTLHGGTYKLRFEKSLYRSFTQPSVVLGVDQTVRVDARIRYLGQECDDPEFECFPQGYVPQVVGSERVGTIRKQVDGGWVGVVEDPQFGIRRGPVAVPAFIQRGAYIRSRSLANVLAAAPLDGGREIPLRRIAVPKGVCDFSQGVYGSAYPDGGTAIVVKVLGSNDADELVECINGAPP